MTNNLKSKVTVIIPVKNEQDKLLECIKSISKHNTVSVNFIVVDDNSTDDTVKNAQALFDSGIDGNIYVNDGSEGHGAGASRNLGLQHIKSEPEYVLFFDADDTMPEGALDKVVEAADINECDVAIAKYDYITHNNKLASMGMTGQDRNIWQGIMTNKDTISFDIKRHGYFLETVNYPWNKLLRYTFIKKIGLYFSTTPVNNDVFAHWQCLMYSEKITLVNTSICYHFVVRGNDQITNVADTRRLVVFQVLNEVEALILSEQHLTDSYYHYFLRFKIKLLKWVEGFINPDIMAEFNQLLTESYVNFNFERLIAVSEHMPGIAADAAFFKLGKKL
ncbi:glycosyltransferase [Photobacterium sp. ZSDE20]|uniref:Glycosyltransferase n=1 Tax=Photobacterium pectinilyticum TaxID=2906793 RepID=A0ABT1N0S4_9GAMM|nr:glycosyltransferase family 2 protein [Photobacterium sp. ZSDE20]MCQ1058341.1 glycosyltransferase [Photobacterium sp. ZSDE20]MDD1823136.1 glycosyltransferase [Photobacterium sp. ZSDE20]